MDNLKDTLVSAFWIFIIIGVSAAVLKFLWNFLGPILFFMVV